MVQLIATLTFALAITPAAAAQSGSENRRTLLDGVFTAAQAERGKNAFTTYCSSCHMDDLSGLSAPALKGDMFIDEWREDSLKSLFTFVTTRMPAGSGPKPNEQEYLDIITHVLTVNTFPSGSKELTRDEVGNIQFVGKEGPAPIPRFALVEVVGCLAQAPDNEWKLTNVSAPVRNRNEEVPKPAEVQAFAPKALGTDALRLVYIDSLRPQFVPERNIGHKLYAKGYVLRNEKGDGLSVSWLESVGPTCP